MVFIRSQTIQVSNVVIVGEQRRASNLIKKLTLSERELKGAAVYQQTTRSTGILKMALAWA